MRLSRRNAIKGLAAGAAALAAPRTAHSSIAPDELHAEWKQIAPGVWKATIGDPEAHTPVRMRLFPPALDKLESLPRAASAEIAPPNGRVDQRGCTFSLVLGPDEAIFGFGLQLLSSECRGKKRTVRVNADPRVDSGDSHAPVPFYVSSRGYGILVDTLRQAEFYCGDAKLKPTQAIAATALAVNTPQDTADRQTGESALMTVQVPRASGVDVYLFSGPDMLTAVRRYNLFSGGGVRPPEWGLGFWYRIEMHAGTSEVLELANEFRHKNIPCDVIGLEPGWQTHSYSCSFAWAANRFADPVGLVKQLGASGFHVNLWEHAFTHPSSPLFDPLLSSSGDYAVWGGLVPDFAAQPARDAFASYHRKTFVENGISGFKLDECDDSDFTGGWSFPPFSRFPSGVDGEQMHAIFGLRYQHTILQAFADSGKQTYSLARSSGALAAPYPFVLYSDLYDHREFVRGLVTSGFCGLLWCPEVRDAVSDEDLIRRLQTAVFSPLAMINAWYIKSPPWKQRDRDLNNANHFQQNWQQMEERCRNIIGLRMQLVPYLLSAFECYQQDGTPPFRALALDYPEQRNLRKVDDSFLIGDRMLVAPLFAGEASREVILPPGEWHDFWTGRAITGSIEKVSAEMENIPVYVKGGSIIPWAGVGSNSAAPEARQLTARVYGDGSLPWTMPDQLRLSWNPTAQRGDVQQIGKSAQPYQVVSWQRIG
jgi:alpha-D-xyloside xylohydrolase